MPFTSLASLAIRLASESNPRLAIPTNGVPSTLGHVEQALAALDGDSRGLAGSVGHAEHAREVVAAAAGDERERRVSRALERAGERAQQPVAAERGHGLALGGRARGLLAACSTLRVVTVRWAAPRRSSVGDARPGAP